MHSSCTFILYIFSSCSTSGIRRVIFNSCSTSGTRRVRLFSIFSATAHGDYCYQSASAYLDYYYDDDYCPFGCCGYYGNEYCCSYAGPVVGIFFGMIAFIGIIIALVICRRRRYNRGVIIRTGGLTNNGLVVTCTNLHILSYYEIILKWSLIEVLLYKSLFIAI